MKRLTSAAAIAAAVLLAACGSGGDGSANPTDNAASGTSTDTVSVARVDGIGDVLVDSSGMALYRADEEADGQVRCTDSCTSFWMPLEPGAGAPTAAPGVGDLGVIERPDGTQQVTADGRLLYTFSEDSPGSITGDGFEDDFGDQHLTWHAVRVTGTSASSPGPASGPNADTSQGGLPDYGD